MRPRLSAALAAGRTAAALSRRLHRGGGTVIAGHVVSRLAPAALTDVARSLPLGSVVVSGTNGKTTTARVLAHILRQAGYSSLHNRAGANLLSGLFTAVATDADWRGQPRSDIGVFEVDEATLPAALARLEPRVLLLTNIFRDQLDRYGEVHYVAGLWRTALAALSPGSQIVLNADDPLVAALAHDAPSAATMFGIDVAGTGTPSLPHAADARLCPRCGSPLRYDLVHYGHLGWYACTACSFRRPAPAVRATAIELLGDAGADIELTTPAGVMRVRSHLPGLYNVYNVLAAAAASFVLGIPRHLIAQGLTTFTAAFGRLERIRVEERELFLALVKNPVGFTEVLRTILAPRSDGPLRRTLVLAINDRFADGTDVSWLWDVDFESLPGKVNEAVCTGLRAADIAVRLKYAGVEPGRIRVEADPRRALEEALRLAEPGETVYVLPTYTAMLAIRDILRQTGYVKGFWED